MKIIIVILAWLFPRRYHLLVLTSSLSLLSQIYLDLGTQKEAFVVGSNHLLGLAMLIAGIGLPAYFAGVEDGKTELEAERDELKLQFNQASVLLDDAHRHNEALEQQRDELLAVVEHIRRCIPYGGFVQIHDGSDTLAQIDAAIAKVKGGAS